jgi:hypothetical protein
MPPAREPAPMAIPITVRGANAVASKGVIVYANTFTFTYGYHHYNLEFDSPIIMCIQYSVM